VGRDKLEKSGKKRLKDMGGKRVEIERFIKPNIQKNIGVPARVSRINQFEEAHKDTLNFRVNVFGHDGSKNSIFPLRPSKRTDEVKDTINILLLHLDEGSHFVLIRDICKVVKTKYNQSSRSRHELCPHCMSVMSGKKALERHMSLCGLNKPQKVEMPPKGSTMKFKSFNRLYKTGLFATADFEAKMASVDATRRPDTPKSNFIEEQLPVSYCLAVFDRFGEVIFRREEAHETNCLDLFFDALDDATIACREKLAMVVPHSLDEREANALRKAAKSCILCAKGFSATQVDEHIKRKVSESVQELGPEDKKLFNQVRVIDHDHMTGIF
jgi:hypothetical protein